MGPTLILIHGGLDNAHVFEDLAPTLTSHFRVIAYDLRGHGHSDAKGPFDTATRTEDLCGLMDRLGITKAHLAGWSLGGNDITALAGTCPERVGSIVHLERAYDWGSLALANAFKSLPIDFFAPANHELAGRISGVSEDRMVPCGERHEPIRSLCSRLDCPPIG